MNVVQKKMRKTPYHIAMDIQLDLENAYEEGRLREWIDQQLSVEAASSFDWGSHPGYHINIMTGVPTIWVNTGTQTINGSIGFNKGCVRIDLNSKLCESLEGIIREEKRISPIMTDTQSDIAFVLDERRRNPDLDDDEFRAYMHRICSMETAFCGGGMSDRNKAMLDYVDRHYDSQKRFTVVRGNRVMNAR